ncbi:molybdopterin biosynthesis protein [Defluviimonas sp. 20V17]|uniref:Molybdopterin molybdenumtransferase n=1 Tax=Allgaiera indica TaxID=765699 RepID=A0AAN4ZZR5_9RHOB|nr:gephyrin-like molybdotransferase Glp [Allgaiera indica]KDB01753.1 molybdopterin biosynthesis protein [Defluviimonas sp. 20V17]GHE02523.1 molybdopterin molybdenumtransferase MoeA [Allgaiera indica]SDX28513.1 molybdopterin molybdochelatase [Allgaiera indica]
MSSRKLLNDCFAHGGTRLRHDEAVALITGRLSCVTAVRRVPLRAATGRWLAAPVTAPRDVPLHRNAAVDGYAFAAPAPEGTLPVAARIAAGDLAPRRLAPGTAARIFTGAPVPEGADSVAMQEDCSITPDGITLPHGLKRGANVRQIGEDVAKGAEILSPGARLRPQDIAALASFGLASVRVQAPVRVAVLSNGDELRDPGGSIAPGQVFDSNRTMLKALIATLPCTVTDLGILPDQAPRIEAAIAEAARNHDLILTSGGVSQGEEDHVVAAIDRLGSRHLWQIAIKPGRPMSFGQIGDCVFLGLPGNPVAAFVCFLLYARPAIVALGGGTPDEPTRYHLPAGFSQTKKPGRREFWRGWLETTPQGPVARKFARDGSGLISGLRRASGLIEVLEDETQVTEGAAVRFLPFDQFGIQG